MILFLIAADVKKDNKSVTIALQQTDEQSVAQAIQKNDVDKGRESTNVDVFKENVSGIKRHRTEEQRADGANEQTQNPKSLFPGFSTDNIFALKFSYGVNAYKHWVLNKNAAIESSSKKILSKSLFNKGPRLFKVELLEASNDELNQSLSYFVKEVRKPDGEEYAPDSILYLCLGILCPGSFWNLTKTDLIILKFKIKQAFKNTCTCTEEWTIYLPTLPTRNFRTL